MVRPLLLIALLTAAVLAGCSPAQRRDKPIYQDIAVPGDTGRTL